MTPTYNRFAKRAALVLLSASFLFGCKSNREVTAGTETDNKETAAAQMGEKPVLLASIERTACFGKCPMYKVTYMDNGQVTYIGKRFVEKIGTYSALLDLEEINSIKAKAEEYRYFELDSLYPTTITDFPSVLTEVNINGRRKKVIDRRNPPVHLQSFEKFLDSLLEGKELRKVSDETDYGRSNQ